MFSKNSLSVLVTEGIIRSPINYLEYGTSLTLTADRLDVFCRTYPPTMLKLPCTCHSPLCHTRLNAFLSLLSCGKVQSQVFAPNIYLMLGGVSLWFLVV